MTRPPSIVNFERCYRGGVLLGWIATALNWKHMQDKVAVQQTEAMVGAWYMPTILAISLLVNLLLWYFAARRGSKVAKWIIVVFFVLACFGVAMNMARHDFPPGLAGVASVAAFVINAIAVWLLFRPDAKAWFGEDAAASEVDG